jgi:hypothetical protein
MQGDMRLFQPIFEPLFPAGLDDSGRRKSGISVCSSSILATRSLGMKNDFREPPAQKSGLPHTLKSSNKIAALEHASVGQLHSGRSLPTRGGSTTGRPTVPTRELFQAPPFPFIP